jgi:hypothetical protein
MESTIKWLPAFSRPFTFDVQKRIQQLRGYLDPKNPDYQPEQQHINIKAVIKLYEDGKIDGINHAYIKDGKVVPREETLKGPTCSWAEGICHQYAEKHAYGHGSFGANFHEASISLFINARDLNFLQIRMILRLTPALGGDGTVCGIIAMNDTGSDILSLFTSDLPYLGNIQGYGGWLGLTPTRDANGGVTFFPRIWVQVQLVRDDNNHTPWSDWIDEEAIIKPSNVPMSRLSGAGIRQVLFFGTAPGNHLLAIGATKGGMPSLL